MDFQTQMQFVKERNQIKYENRLMAEEDNESKHFQIIFNRQRLEEQQRKNQELEMEELRKIQKKILEEDEAREKKEMRKFISSYVIQKMNSGIGTDFDLNKIKNEAMNIYYDRKLKSQQDEEYKNSCISDFERLRY